MDELKRTFPKSVTKIEFNSKPPKSECILFVNELSEIKID